MGSQQVTVTAGAVVDAAGDNVGENLAFYDVITGDWRNLFRELDKIKRVTVEDVQRVAKECFTSKNRSVGIIKTTPTDN